MSTTPGAGLVFLGTALGVVGVLIAGCTTGSTRIVLNPTIDRQAVVERLPLAVGVYYSPKFRALEVPFLPWESRSDLRMYRIAIGEVSVALLGEALATSFGVVQTVSERPPASAGNPALTAVIEPGIENFNYEYPTMTRKTYEAVVIYRFTLYDRRGEMLGSWTVTGEAEKPAPPGMIQPLLSRETVELALQDAARKLIVGLREVPEVRRLLRDAGVEPPRVAR